MVFYKKYIYMSTYTRLLCVHKTTPFTYKITNGISSFLAILNLGFLFVFMVFLFPALAAF